MQVTKTGQLGYRSPPVLSGQCTASDSIQCLGCMVRWTLETYIGLFLLWMLKQVRVALLWVHAIEYKPGRLFIFVNVQTLDWIVWK